MRKRFVFATAVVFAVVIMIIVSFDGPFMLPSAAVAQKQRINTRSLLPPASNSNTTAPPTIISPSTYSWVAFIIFVIVIAAIAWKLKHKSGKHKQRQHFSDSVKEKVLEKQHHRCADCNRVLNVVDWHHRNEDRSDNRESNCVALCPNCHALQHVYVYLLCF